MVNLKNKLIELDRNPVELSINFNRTSKYKSSVGGTLALLFFITAIGIICFRTLDLFQRNHRSIHLNVFKENDLEVLNLTNINATISLVTANDSEIIPIEFEEYLSYGVQALLEEYWLTGDGKRHFNSTKLVACKNHEYACLPENKTISVLGNLEIKNTKNYSENDVVYRRNTIVLVRCNPNKTEGCEEYQNIHIKPKVNFKTPEVESEGKIISYNMTKREFQSHKLIVGEKIVAYTFYLKRVNVLTYSSIWPEFIHYQEEPTNSKTDWFYDEEKEYEEYGKADDELFEVYFKRSAYTHEFTIKFDRFNKMVSEVNGMLAFVALILSWLYRGYNDWSFEQDVRKKLGIFYVKPTLWNFYKLKFRWRGETDEEIEQRLVLAAKLDYFKVAEQMPVIIEEEEFDFNTSFAQEAQESSNFNPLLINRPTTLSPSSNRFSIN